MTGPRTTPENMTRADQRVLRIGTRGSPLALVQARQTAAALEAMSGGAYRGEIVTFTTSGDKLTTERLINAGGKGLFTKEIDIALDQGEIDVAVHSLKDVPSVLPDGQEFVAFPQREDVREGFICQTVTRLADLPDSAVIGTASLRREAQTLAQRPSLKIVPFRGNVATRLRKLEEGQADATYLAMAGLTRLGLAHLAHPIAVSDMLPSAGQGIIGIVARTGTLDDEAIAAFEGMTETYARQAAITERAFLASLDGSCRTPIAGHLSEEEGQYILRGEVLSPDGQQRWTALGGCDLSADDDTLSALGREVGETIREEAGGDLPQFQD